MRTTLRTTLHRTITAAFAACALALTAHADLLRGPAVSLDRVPTAAAQYTDGQDAGPALPPARRNVNFMRAIDSIELAPHQRRTVGDQRRAYTELLRAYRRTHEAAYTRAREQSLPVRDLENAAPSPDAHHAAIWEILTPAQRDAVTAHLEDQRDQMIARVQASRAADHARQRPDPMRGRNNDDIDNADTNDNMSPGDPDTALDRARDRLAQLPPEQRRRLAQIIERAEREQPQGQPKPPPSMNDVKVPTP